MGQVASVLTLLTHSLGFCWGGLHLLMSARVCLYWLCVHFRMARVASCHGRDKHLISGRPCFDMNLNPCCCHAVGL